MVLPVKRLPSKPWSGCPTVFGISAAVIPIRTTLCARNEMRVYAGGGIVADSTPEDEFEETETKIAAIRRAVAAFSPARSRSAVNQCVVAKRR